VRQALNYAIDRDHVVALAGGPASWRATCQILPPNFQGYEPFCPYTLDPDAGVWSAPDPDRAGALIKDADAIGEKVTVWVNDDPEVGPVPPGGRVEIARYVVEVLNVLGLRANLKILHHIGEYSRAIYAGEPQAYLFGWGADYPRAVNFLDTQFRCGSPYNASGFCDKSLDAAIDEAQRLQATDPGASNRAWIEIEHQLVEDAVWAPTMNPLSAYAFSARTENVQFHPQWGILLSRLWVQ
jgi:peptide/nickel transport system substrate-binding protein